MAETNWQRIKALLADALDLDPAERTSFLRSRCAQDDALFESVHELLQSSDTAGDFLEPPERDVAVELLATLTAGNAVGERIGAYRIDGLIASGGMGTVYRASRADGMHDVPVAVKIINQTLTGGEVLRRFSRERKALGKLAHANIARFLDAGVTDAGQPFIVMEHVEGTPIDHYCEREGIGTDERLRLFCQVCSAVQFAHQNLIVHRDLKPGNILVGRDGEPKLLDFGIAKLLDEDQELVEATRTAHRVMTYQYASPEQVRGEAVTTASDVYALGVVLYQLLTGRRPYDVKGRSQQQIMLAICDVEPPTPSSAVTGRIGSGPDGLDVGDHSVGGTAHEDSRRLSRKLRGDLDTILLTALSKEPSRRYATAEQFAEDIQRYLSGLPVRARRPTWPYRARKFVRRNRPIAIAATIAVAFAVFGVSSLIIGAANARAAAVESSRQEKLALQQAERANRIKEFLIDLLAAANPFENDKDVTVREKLEDALTQLDAGELANDPQTRVELYTTIGSALDSLGHPVTARHSLEQALVISEQHSVDLTSRGRALFSLAKIDSETGDFQSSLTLAQEAVQAFEKAREVPTGELGVAIGHVGTVYMKLDQIAEASATLGDALKTACLDPADESQACVIVLGYEASLRSRIGDFSRAEELFRQIIEIRLRNDGPDSLGLSTALLNLANLLRNQRRLPEARELEEEVVRIRTKVLRANHPATAAACARLAKTLSLLDEVDKATVMFETALEALRQTYGEKHEEVAACLHSLGQLSSRNGDLVKAESQFREALVINEELFGPESLRVGVGLHDLGKVYTDQYKFEQSLDAFERALHIYEQRLGPNDRNVGSILVGLGTLYTRMKNFEGAEKCFRRTLEIHAAVFGPDHVITAPTRISLGEALMHEGQFAEAEQLQLRGLEIYESAHGESHSNCAIARVYLAQVLERDGRLEDAIHRLEEAQVIFEHLPARSLPWEAATAYHFSRVLDKKGQYKSACEFGRSSLKTRTSTLGHDHPATAATKHQLALILLHLNELDEATDICTQALEARRKLWGSDHEDTLASMELLAQIHLKAARPGDAKALLVELVSTQEKAGGNPNHLVRAQILLASADRMLGNWEAAEQLLQSVGIALQTKSDENTGCTRACLTELVHLYEDRQQPEQVAKFQSILEELGGSVDTTACN